MWFVLVLAPSLTQGVPPRTTGAPSPFPSLVSLVMLLVSVVRGWHPSPGRLHSRCFVFGGESLIGCRTPPLGFLGNKKKFCSSSRLIISPPLPRLRSNDTVRRTWGRERERARGGWSMKHDKRGRAFNRQTRRGVVFTEVVAALRGSASP